jgi:protein-tyrosine phosphatase
MTSWSPRWFSLALASVACSSAETPRQGSPRTLASPAIAQAGATANGTDPSASPTPRAAPGACQPHRTVLEPETSNARDLGGTPLADGSSVACGAFFRGPPLRLSEDGCAVAAELGLRTLLDLRIDGEREAAPDSACVDAERVFAPLPVPSGLSAADYLNVLHETQSIATAFHTLAEPLARPIYFHCTYGRDRTGVVAALLLLALGASRSSVMDEYLLSQPYVGAYPESLSAVLDEVELRGGAEQVLSDAGISEAELTALRRSVTTE